MELGGGQPLFARFACDDYAAMADMLEEAVTVDARAGPGCAASPASTCPTAAEPLILIIIDELAALTAYLTDRT